MKTAGDNYKYCLGMLRAPIFHAIIITIIGALVYANTLHAPFQFDDNAYINHGNLSIKLTDILNASALTKGADWGDTFTSGLLTRRFGFLTFMLNYKLHGLSVMGFHVVNILIHIVAAMLVYCLTTRCWYTPFMDSCFQGMEKYREIYSRWTAFFCASLFVAHPINTQAITYVVQRFASLATLLYLLALYAYLSSMLQQKRTLSVVLYGISLIAAILAMFTKEISFTLPLVMFLCDRLFLQRLLSRSLLALTPFLLTMIIIPFNLLQAKSLLHSGGEGLPSSIDALAGGETLSRHDYFLTELRVVITYIRLLVFPIDQNLDYDYPVYTSVFAPPVFASFAVILLIALGALMLWRASAVSHGPRAGLYRLIAFGIFWFFITLSVESSFQPIENVIYEHRLYLPFFGFVLAVVSGVTILWHKIDAVLPRLARMVPVVGFLIVFMLACTASARNAIWRDSITLWEDVVNKSPNKARVLYNLGQSYQLVGRLNDAQKAWEKAIKADPNHSYSLNSLGNIAMLANDYPLAEQYYRRSLKVYPGNAETHYNLAMIYEQTNRVPESVLELELFLQKVPSEYKNLIPEVRRKIESHNIRGVSDR
jgi:tetratricopeptide (TPR) repeat protein